MKKAISALLCVILAFLPVFSAVGESLAFTPGEYPRSEQNGANFTYRAAEMEHCVVAIADHLHYFEDESAVQAAERIEQSAALLWNTFSDLPLQKPTVYLVLATDRGAAFVLGGDVFCTPEDLFSDAFLSLLMQAMLGTDIVWLAHGCATYVLYGDGGVPGDDILAMYDFPSDPGIINMLPIRFYAEWNTPINILTADLIAMSLVEDILTYDGMEALTEEPTPQRLAAWRGRMNFPEQTEQEKADILRRFSFSLGRDDGIIVSSAHQVFTFNMGEAGIGTVTAVEDFLYRAAAGRDFLIAYLAENASEENAGWFTGNLAYIRCDAVMPRQGFTSRFRTPDTVVLYRGFDYIHEMVHGMLGQSDALAIFQEGLAMYFDLLQPQSEYAALIRQSALEPETAPAWRVGDDLYIDMMGVSAQENFDMRTWIDALALYAIQNPGSEDAAKAIKAPLSDQAAYSRLDEPGISLSYIQGCSLMYYLIDQYGLDTVLTYVRTDQTLMDTFGRTFNMLQKEWRLYLAGKSGGA